MSGSLIVRQVISDECSLTLNSGRTYKFRKGDKVAIFPTIGHYDSRIYSNPEEFIFNRFVNTPTTYTLDGKSISAGQCFLPFGAGATWCPGRKFARNEIKTVIAYLFAKFDVSFKDVEAARRLKRNYDGSRAGIGIFPPSENNIELNLTPLL